MVKIHNIPLSSNAVTPYRAGEQKCECPEIINTTKILLNIFHPQIRENPQSHMLVRRISPGGAPTHYFEKTRGSRGDFPGYYEMEYDSRVIET